MTQVATSVQDLSRPQRPSPRFEKLLAGVILLGVLVWSVSATGIGRRDLVNEGGWKLLMRFATAAWQPEISADFLWLTLDSALVTMAYAVCGAALSVVLGTLGGLLSSEVWWHSVVRGSWLQRVMPYQAPWLAVRALLSIPRAIHEAIWGLIFVNIFGLDPLVAVLAIGIPFGAITAKVFSEIIDETPRQPYLALRNSGVTPLKALCYTLLPQSLPDLLSYAFYRFECSIRASAILGIIGAGGLGYQLLLSLQSLRYGQIWTLIYALCILNGLADWLSSFVRHRLGSRRLAEGTGGVQPENGRPQQTHDLVLRTTFLACLGLIPLSLWYIDVNWARIFSQKSVTLLQAVLIDSYPPVLDAGFLGELVRVSGQTLAMSVLAMVFAGTVGTFLAFPAASSFVLPGGMLDTGGDRRRGVGLVLLLGTRGLLLLMRAVPPPIWALVAVFVLFPGILPGAVALGLYTAGVLGRLHAEVVENLDGRPVQALAAQGVGPGKLFLYAIFPCTWPVFLAYILYRWEVCIRATVIVGLVGAGGIGRLLLEQLSSFDYRHVFTTLMALTILTIAVDLLSALTRRALR